MQSCLSTVKALADETRLRILRILMTGTYNVNELVAILAMGQSRVSRHLRILSDAGLVRPRRQGTWVYYGLTGLWEGETRSGFLPSFADELSANPLPLAGADDRGIKTCLGRRRKQAEQFFSSVAERADPQRDEIEGPAGHHSVIVELLGEDGAEHGTVVDLGTGTGRLLPLLARGARRVIGIDGAREMLDVARRRAEDECELEVELRLGSLEHLPLGDGEADAMVANMVLHHVANPLDVLREVHRGLATGGRFLLADYESHELEFHREKLGDLWLGFDRDELSGWLELAGFEIESERELPGNRRRPGVFVIAGNRK
jgi:ArsR family transcriptional regulator